MAIRLLLIGSVIINILLIVFLATRVNLFESKINDIFDPRLLVVEKHNEEIASCIAKAIPRFYPPASFSTILPWGGAEQHFYLEKVSVDEAEMVSDNLNAFFRFTLPSKSGFFVQNADAKLNVDPCRWIVSLNGNVCNAEVAFYITRIDDDHRGLLLVVKEEVKR